MAEPLDLDRPLWQAHLLTGLPGGRFAVLLKLHHALADGLRAVQLGIGLLDGYAVRDAAPAAPGSSLLRLACPWWLARQATSTVARLPAVARRASSAAGIASAVLCNVRRTVPASPLSAAPPYRRRLALLRLDAAAVREVRRRHGGTDHDVLLTVLSSALRAWLDRHGYRPETVDVRALVPVSRRDGGGHGNVLSGYLCPLPVQEPNPRAQLQAVRATMNRAKAAGPARGAGAFPLLADLVPPVLQRALAPVARHGARRLFDTVVTNVPVPGLPLTLGGAPLRAVYPIAPLAYGQTLGIALSAHRGTVHIGLHASGAAVPDLDALADAIPAALDRLRTAELAAAA